MWLDAAKTKAILGAVAADVEDDPLEEACTATRSFVEENRGDLWVSDGADPPTLTYTPSPKVVHGAALYAYRLYQRRNNPLGILGTTDVGPAGILREDPDIARLLGIGRARKFRFGGAYTPPAEVAL